MGSILQASITTNFKTKDAKFCNVQALVIGDVDSEDIIDELVKDGLDADRQTIHEIITRFNKKAADLVVSGYKVNTGLVKVNPEIRGIVFGREWNPNTNRVEVTITNGDDLQQAINETIVDIMEEEIVNNKNTDMNQKNQSADNTTNDNLTSTVNNGYSNISNDNPACGIAFRRWLCKA